MIRQESGVAKYWRRRLPKKSIPIAGLLIFFLLAIQTAVAQAPTADEGMHLLRGQVLRQTGRLVLQGEHLPLSHRLIGTFLTIEPTLPDVKQLLSRPNLSPIELVQEFLWRSNTIVARAMFIGRLPIILVGLLFGAFLAWWSKLKIGMLGQAITMVLFAFSPNLLASSTLATTDAVAATTFVLALLAWWYFWESPGLWRWFVAALAFGLAIGSKLSGIIVVPSALVLSYAQKKDMPWWKPGAIWLSTLPVTGLVVWIIYGFELGRVPGFPFPVPAATYLNSVLDLTRHMESGQIAYLLGERSLEGWYHYFGAVFLFKTPGITLLLLLLACIYLSWHRQWRRTLYLWFPALALFAAASYSRFNIGYRHILAIVPLVWLLIAETAPFWQGRRGRLFLLLVLLLIYLAGSVRQSPHFLAYFNEFVGGSGQGFRYLGDSNIDWGQDLNLLARYAAELDTDPLYISYFGAGDPAYYGLEEPPLFDERGNPINFAPANPAPGRYAISVNHIQGPTINEPDLFEWFRRREPVDHLGYSILIYDVFEAQSGSWIGQCLDPVAFLDESTAAQLVGQDTLRHVYFDCRTSWVIPAGGDPGWYILPPDVDPSSISDHLADNLTQVYANLQSSRTPAYQVYYWSGSDLEIDKIIARSGTIMSTEGRVVLPPVNVEGTANFLGGLINGSTWGSIWQTESLTEAPLSVLMHLYTDDPLPSVADGLGYQGIQWQPGDIFIQYHDFGDLPGRYLETGLYNYVTGEHLLIEDIWEAVRIFPP